MRKKYKILKRITSFMLIFAMMMTMLSDMHLPVKVFAADGDSCASASCTGTYQNGFCSVCGGYQAPKGTGKKAESPYEISNAGNLYWFAKKINDYYNGTLYVKLTADIVVNPGTFDSEGNYTPANGETYRKWTPIKGSLPFFGTFDGQGYTISGLYFKGTGYTGLFGWVDKATICNVGVVNSYFYTESTNGAGQGGGILGQADTKGTLVKNCYTDCTVIATSYAGGIAGYSYAQIENCYSLGSV